MTSPGAEPDIAPVIRVESGNPTDDELAAVVVAIAALRKAAAEVTARAAQGRSSWASPLRLVRQPLHPGPGQWRARAFPR
jgi:hypothetical protein